MNKDERSALEELLRAYGCGQVSVEVARQTIARALEAGAGAAPSAPSEEDPSNSPFTVLDDLVLAGELSMNLASPLYGSFEVAPTPSPAPAPASSPEHRWVAVCHASFSDEQAEEWRGRAAGGVNETAFSLVITDIVCARCGASFTDSTDVCLGGRVASGHRWAAVATISMSADEARDWYAEDRPPVNLPRVLEVVCTLCGATTDGAPSTCPEREFWHPADGEAVA